MGFFYDIKARDVISVKVSTNQQYNLRGHNMQIQQRLSKTNLRKNYFTLRVTQPWKSLPLSIFNARTFNIFKNKLDQHWKMKI